MRDDGSLRITGRVKDMVIRGGENVPVIEVENALIEIPCVAEVAIVGIPDDRLGERACAVIVPTEAKTRIDLALLQSHLASINMAKQFWPEFVVVRKWAASHGLRQGSKSRTSGVGDCRINQGSLTCRDPQF